MGMVDGSSDQSRTICPHTVPLRLTGLERGFATSPGKSHLCQPGCPGLLVCRAPTCVCMAFVDSAGASGACGQVLTCPACGMQGWCLLVTWCITVMSDTGAVAVVVPPVWACFQAMRTHRE